MINDIYTFESEITKDNPPQCLTIFTVHHDLSGIKNVLRYFSILLMLTNFGALSVLINFNFTG